MQKWINRTLAAHLFASISVWCFLFVASLLVYPVDTVKDSASWIIWAFVSPIRVPMLLIEAAGGRLTPHWANGTCLLAYLAAFSFIMIGWLRIEARRKLRSERARLGLCRRCGYDLRGSASRCPECGKIV
jgi:hypothetical protein